MAVLLRRNGKNPLQELMERWGEDPSLLYDESEQQFETSGVRVMPGLTDWEKEDAMILAKYFWMGLVLVSGPVGAGKDLFTKSTCWKFKRYFGRHVLLDERPRELFGPYVPFNEDILKSQIRTSDLIASGKVKESVREVAFLQEYTESFKDWMKDKGTILLKDGVMGLSEFWRYCNRRRPTARMNVTMNGIIRLMRHLGITIFGLCQQEDDIDEIATLPMVTTRVLCSWMTSKPNTMQASIYRCKYVSDTGVFQMADKRPFVYEVCGDTPREALGGKRYYDIFVSKSQSSLGMAKFSG